MFVLYAIPAGLIAGRLLRGRLDGLADLRVRWGGIALAALAAQVVLFSPLGGGIPDAVGRAAYVASTAAVLIVVAANLGITGAAVIAAGAAANLAAIIANGGVMPADAAALATAGVVLDAPSNSAVLGEPALRPLTDIFAIPAAVPLANVFSVGDVLIGLGVAIAIAAAMRRSPNVTPDPGPRNQSSEPR